MILIGINEEFVHKRAHWIIEDIRDGKYYCRRTEKGKTNETHIFVKEELLKHFC